MKRTHNKKTAADFLWFEIGAGEKGIYKLRFSED